MACTFGPHASDYDSVSDDERTAPGRSAWLIVGAACLLTLPALAMRPSVGVDPSWKLGLHLARELGFVVGRDTVFNYGPWGFLNIPLTLTHSQWLAAVAYHLVAQLALFGAVGVWMRRHLRGWRALLPAVPLVLFLPSTEYRMLLALALWLRVALGTGRRAPLWGGLIGAAGAAMLMVKFSMGIAALAVVGGGVLAALWLRRPRTAAALGWGYLAAAVGFGLVALGSLDALAGFFSGSSEISVGYAMAMERRGPLWQPIAVLAALGLVLAGSLRDRQRCGGAFAALVLPFLGLLAITFKHAFVRQETHAYIAFEVGAVVLAWIVLELDALGGAYGRRMRRIGAAVLVAGAMVTTPPTHLAGLPASAARKLGGALAAERELRDPGHRERLRAELRQELPLADGVLELVGRRTVDVLTLEVALLEAWELNWRPRRVLQSYAVATSRLDELDAGFFAGPDAPERLLVDLQGLDTRHPFMDAPRSWRQILSRYRPLGRDVRWLVLGLRDQPRVAVERTLRESTVPFNDSWVEAPQPEAGHLEMRVRLEPSWLGRLVALPWKVPEIRVTLLSSDAQEPRRILPATADEPFPIARVWPRTPVDLAALFFAERLPAPAGVAFFTEGSWAWREAQVEFYQVEWREPDDAPSN